jgi:hypothetical protein
MTSVGALVHPGQKLQRDQRVLFQGASSYGEILERHL